MGTSKRRARRAAQIGLAAMDMWPACIGSVRDHTEAVIVLDKFHVAQHLGAAVDQVRRSEIGPCGSRATTGW